MRNRQDLEAREAEILGRLGLRARDSAGRRVPEDPDPLRTCFQRDRDRILHSSAFRRLQQKTQVFPATAGDHYRTRLTHSLEVSQMARSACLALGLNADLAEAVALAHDLGHPPFGHVGERALDDRMKGHGNFRHNAQGLRIVDSLEQSYAGRAGLNLCRETRLCLLKGRIPPGFPVADDLPRRSLPYLEGQVVDLCDRVAYVCHDLDDVIRSGLVGWAPFADLALPARAREDVVRRYPDLARPGRTAASRILRLQTASTMISMLVRDIVHATDKALAGAHHVRGPEAARQLGSYLATHSEARARELEEVLDVLRERFYRHEEVLRSMHEMAGKMTRLFDRILAAPATLPERFRHRIEDEGLERTVCDYVAGMTDRYVERLSKRQA